MWRIAIPVLMYVRDVGASPVTPSPGQAQFDARLVRGAIAPGCTSRCRVEMLGMSAAHTWRVRLDIGNWQRCFDLDPTVFGYTSAQGFSGVTSAPCRI
jgi:hypothetical protein